MMIEIAKTELLQTFPNDMNEINTIRLDIEA